MKLMAVYESKGLSGNTTPKVMVWPDSSIIGTRKPVFVPDDTEYNIHICLAARIDAVGKTVRKKFAHRYYKDVMPVGILLTKEASDKVASLEDPLACETVADYTIIVGQPVKKEENGDYQLEISRKHLDTESGEEILDIITFTKECLEEAIEKSSIKNTLKTGDIIATLSSFRFPALRETLLKVTTNRSNISIENKLK